MGNHPSRPTPPQLSVSLTAWATPEQPVENIVIGSGYGGSVAALRLAQAGEQVVVLERGSEYLPGDFPNDIGLLPKHLKVAGGKGSAAGVFEWHLGQGVVSLTGNGIGGGSLINAGVTLAPDVDVMRQEVWPAALRHELDEPHLSFKAAMARALKTLRSTAWPRDEGLPKTQALHRLAPYLQEGAKARNLALTIDPARCTRCGDCATGCNIEGAKITLRDSYLAQAAAFGATLVSGAKVYKLTPLPDGLWALCVLATDCLAAFGTLAAASASARHARTIIARRVVLAAGTFGSTELLQRSRAMAGESAFPLSPALGTRFSGNGDSVSFLVDHPMPVGSVGHGAVPGLPAVGPTITVVVDLRRSAAPRLRGALHDMESRLVVQDGALPGAIARAAQEMLATAYTLGQLDHFGYRVLRSAQGLDPLASGAMAQHSQVLLTMGHDGSRGYLARLPALDITVPVWPDDPAELATYRQRQRMFARTAGTGAVHVQPPTWQLMPEGAGSVMSGPKAPRLMLTVHPLGGAPMSDVFDQGVVDDIGRVWRAPGEVWPGLLVLDGSIVPTSLGVNPLLTITALAERAMAHLLKTPAPPQSRQALPENGRGGSANAAPQAPRAFARDEPLEPDISLFERLTCESLNAELRLEMGSAAWFAMWDKAAHRVELRNGRLQLKDPGTAAPQATYDITAGWFELLPAGMMPFRRAAQTPHAPAAGWLRSTRDKLTAVLNALAITAELADHSNLVVTWLFARGWDDIRRAQRAGASGGSLWPRVVWLIRGLAHAGEKRTMRYRLTLVRREGQTTPRELVLIGTKHVGYAANWPQLARWAWRHGAAAWRGEGVPPPVESFWEQITDPYIVLLPGPEPGRWREALARWWPAGSRPFAHGRFRVDAAGLLAQAPLHLHSGDLTGGALGMAAYPALFLRYALKTRLFDFRLPDYSGQAVVDTAGDAIRVGDRWVIPRAIDLQVRRGRSEGEPRDAHYPSRLTLRLWHYACDAGKPARLFEDAWYGHPVWRARSVLLLHAFGQSGAMFTLPSLQPNMTAKLLAESFDVWVLEHRISTRLPYTDMPSTIDQIARFDVPAAVDHMLGHLHVQHQATIALDAPVQVFCFAQCIGAAALSMSLLDGRLCHGIAAVSALASGNPIAALMPKLAGAVISQTHPFLVGTAITRAKTWVPAVLRDVLGRGAVPFAVREPVKGLAPAWLDRVLASLPVPDDEHCPAERNPQHAQDDCATCRRIRFIEAPLFLHRNLSPETHADLPRLFGDANLHLFAHAARCVDNERLVDNDGRPAYVHDERMRRHWGLPLAFLHGMQNELFHVASARRAATEYHRLYPGLARQIEQALGRPGAGAAWLVEGFGHVDVVIGKDAPQQIFQPMAKMFQALWCRHDEALAPALDVFVTARPPRAGPWIGAVDPLPDDRVRVGVAFVIDDRFSEGKAGADGLPGTRTWAWLRSGEPGHRHYHRLDIEDPQRGSALRVAWGHIDVPEPRHGASLTLRGYSVHETLVAQGVPPQPELAHAHGGLEGSTVDATFAAWCTALLASRAYATRAAARCTASAQRLRARGTVRSVARLSSTTLEALRCADTTTFAAACCRYPGMSIDALRVDNAARALLEAARGGVDAAAPAPAFAVLLGDQIYADATAGLADSLNPIERFTERHLLAFSRGAGAPALGDLLASLPAYMTQDDHEYRDGWPGRGGLVHGGTQDRLDDRRMVCIANEAARSFQQLHMPRRWGDTGSFVFEHGPVRFFVLDTRSKRKLGRLKAPQHRQQIIDATTLESLDAWFAAYDAESALNCLVTGSVLLPRLAPANNPADPGEDTLAWCPPDRAALLGCLHRWGGHVRPRRFLLLSGDYHLAAALSVQIKSRAVGAAVIAPALYAPLPYANATPQALWCNEDLSAFDMQMRQLGGWEGSGFSALRVTRHDGGFSITLTPWLQDHARAATTGAAAAPLTIWVK